MQPSFFVGQCIAFAVLLAIRILVHQRQDLDDKAKANFAQLLILNFLLSFGGLLFYGRSRTDNILWSGSATRTLHDDALLMMLGIDPQNLLQIALVKFVLSNIMALVVAVPIYLLNYWLLNHYKIGRSAIWAVWLTVAVVFVFLLSSVIGGYQFVVQRQ